jgi:hypothetical protein
MMAEHLFVLVIVAIGVGGGVIIVGISIFAKVISNRAVKRKELAELRRDISEIKGNIEDIKEHLADIIIRMD